jgi:hypothetical protein
MPPRQRRLLTGFNHPDHLLAQGPADAATAGNSFQGGYLLGLIDFTGECAPRSFSRVNDAEAGVANAGIRAKNTPAKCGQIG